MLIYSVRDFQIGNAYVDVETQGSGTYDYYWTHALVSDEIHQGIVSNCNFSSGDPSDSCQTYMDIADSVIGNIDNYNIYAPLCFSSSSHSPASVNLDYSFMLHYFFFKKIFSSK